MDRRRSKRNQVPSSNHVYRCFQEQILDVETKIGHKTTSFPLLWTATLHTDLVLTLGELMIRLLTGLIDWKTDLLMTGVLVQFAVRYYDSRVIYDRCTCVTSVSVYYTRYNTWWCHCYHRVGASKGH